MVKLPGCSWGENNEALIREQAPAEGTKAWLDCGWLRDGNLPGSGRARPLVCPAPPFRVDESGAGLRCLAPDVLCSAQGQTTHGAQAIRNRGLADRRKVCCRMARAREGDLSEKPGKWKVGSVAIG